MTVTRIGSGGAWEESFGYSRAVHTGDTILVSGCTSTRDGAVRFPGDPAAQLRLAVETAVAAVVELGGRLEDVVRTRLYVTHRRDCELVGRAHGELFGAVRPAATMVVVAGLLHPDMRVEIEVEAVVGAGGPE
ncbi:RidA family protein [Lapillicoccus jejuensis]|uniref:Enamine deaminase RidA (YjgF/YER057c/UK114 family) n=1 Tax=Lapillicoccus jejuensis TaxID=402171 RepID=A0A542E6S1_9MICO|nr:RidA family protein [Lapillicoccus jejuensis]TQJ11004.1 enamine deaminase RidA (YjgF/YER057c/UK114 family) [Lapillicoccus jejuensis]